MKTHVTSFQGDSFVLQLNSSDKAGSYLWINTLFAKRELLELYRQIGDELDAQKLREKCR